MRRRRSTSPAPAPPTCPPTARCAGLGWALGNFLPYLVAGISFAQIDSSRFVDVSYFGIDITPQSGNPPSPPHVNVGCNYPFNDVSHGKYIAGFDVALGTDYLVTQNIFTRAEFEFLHLGTPNEIRLNTVSARVALGRNLGRFDGADPAGRSRKACRPQRCFVPPAALKPPWQVPSPRRNPA
jgi:hypothetical protein